jgi:ribosome biogenesis GTPase / thiamine phosphate phosphatase
MNLPLAEIGFDDFFAEAWAREGFGPGLEPARIASALRGAYLLWTAAGPIEAPAKPKLIRRVETRPCTGDWVALSRSPPTVEHLLPRRTCVIRKAPGAQTADQALGANVDTLFLVQGLDRDFNVRRLERYLAVARDSGARPVVVLNKADLCEDLGARVAESMAVAGDAAVLTVSAATGAGMDQIRSLLTPGRTAALIGSSGVGKSALTNRLLGGEVREVGAVRDSDGRGRHTTVGRELIRAPEGWLMMDLPGIREVQPTAEEGVEQTFADVEDAIARCRFANCSHEREPGCAVRDALASGALAPGRWSNYLRMKQELGILAARRDERHAGAAKQAMRRLHKGPRKGSHR